MPRPRDEDLFADSTMTFGEHLEELRSCLFRAVIGLAIGFVLGLFVGNHVVTFIQEPLKDALTNYYIQKSESDIARHRDRLLEAGYTESDNPGSLEQLASKEGLVFREVLVNPRELLAHLKKVAPERFPEAPDAGNDAGGEFSSKDLVPLHLWHPIAEDARIQTKSLNAHEAFVIWIKASLLVGALLSSPWVFYQVWMFVAAGLYPHEKQYIHVFLPFSLGLFFLGAAMAFFFVFEPVLTFLFSFNQMLGIDPDPRISEWLGFVLVLPLGFGISFQLPLVMLFLERIGIFDVEAYRSKWRMAILVIAVMSMMLTPADPTSMMLMLVPLTVLYFGGILLCKWMPRNRSPYEEE